MQEATGEQKLVRGTPWKNRVAKVVRNPLAQRLMQWGIRVVVPRQRIGVGLVAFDDRQRVFLLRHVFHPLTPWGLPGGWLKRDEAPASGALRELKEETGLEAVISQALLIEHESKPSHVGIVFLGRLRPGQIRLSSEILEAGWFDHKRLPRGILPIARRAIALAVSTDLRKIDPGPSAPGTTDE